MRTALCKRSLRLESEGAAMDADMVTCPECHGEGIVYASYDAFTDDRHYLVMGACPICEGRGTVPAKQNDNNKENL